MEKCGNCNRGLVQGEVCHKCSGTGLVAAQEVTEEHSTEGQSFPEKVKGMVRKATGKKK